MFFVFKKPQFFIFFSFYKSTSSRKIQSKYISKNKTKSLENGTTTLIEDSVVHDKITVTSSDNNHGVTTPLVLRPYPAKQHLQKSNDNTTFKSSLDYVHRLIEQNERRCEQQERNTKIEQEWQMLGRVVDRLFVFIFLIGTMLIFIFIFYQAPHLRLK